MAKFTSAFQTDITEQGQNHQALYIHDKMEIPTRDEFYTNYPLYKYWSSDDNHKLVQDGINIYIHIPFCIQICDYCFYMKELIKSKDQVDDYVDSLCAEMKLVSERFSLQKRKVKSIYIGGGTPSVLTEMQFKKLMDSLYQHHSIAQPEFAFELEPGTFSNAKLEWYKQYGINRLSLGIQSFDDPVIQLSSRKHTAAQAIKSIKIIQDTGGFELNIDLLSGLAGETMDSWQRSLDTALEQGTDMITVYKMKTYANTNFFKKGVHSQEIELPTAYDEIGFMNRALDQLLTGGYQLWSTFAFSKNGCQSVYIENTWRGEDLVAYGASSFGKLGTVNYQNINNILQYSQKIKQEILPVNRTYAMSFKDQMVKEILLCAARLFSYNKKEFTEKFGFDYFHLIPEVIDELTQKGYITDSRDELVLTKTGVLFGDFVAKTLASSLKEVFAKDAIGFVY